MQLKDRWAFAEHCRYRASWAFGRRAISALVSDVDYTSAGYNTIGDIISINMQIIIQDEMDWYFYV